MNQNIEVINDYLWGVNFQYIKSGYIGELKLMPGSDNALSHVNLTDKGCIILDRCSKLYPALKRLFPIVMKMPMEELERIASKINNPEKLDALGDLYVNVAGWEIKRRCALAEYQKSLPKPTFKDRIKNLRKKVKKWLQSKQV